MQNEQILSTGLSFTMARSPDQHRATSTAHALGWIRGQARLLVEPESSAPLSVSVCEGLARSIRGAGTLLDKKYKMIS